MKLSVFVELTTNARTNTRSYCTGSISVGVQYLEHLGEHSILGQ